jgi:hypothetical protein
MLSPITVKVPLIGEDWQMPLELKHSLYKYLFEDCSKIKPSIYQEWFDALSEEDKAKIRRVKLVKPY